MDLYDQEEQMRKGDEYNERLSKKLRDGCDWSEKDIEKLMSPLDKKKDTK